MEASTPVKPLDRSGVGRSDARRRAPEPDRDRGAEVRDQRPALLPQPPPGGLDVEAEGAQLLHRGAQLAARGRLVRGPLRRRGPRPRRGLAQLHRLPPAPGGARADGLGGPRREADLHDPRPARADRRPLGPQLRQAPREGDAGRDAHPPEHLLRHPLARTRCSSSASSPITRRRTCSSSSSPSSATSGWRPCAGCSSSSASSRTSTTRASSTSAIRPPGKTRATRLAVRLEKLGRSRRARMLPANFWLVLDERLPAAPRDQAPRRARLAPARDAGRAARRRRAAARAHRARLLQLDDLGRLSGGSDAPPRAR